LANSIPHYLRSELAEERRRHAQKEKAGRLSPSKRGGHLSVHPYGHVVSRSTIHFFNPFGACQQLQEAGSLAGVTPEGIKVSRQNREAFNRQLGHDLEARVFHFVSNLGSSVEERVSKVQDFVRRVSMLSRPNISLHYRKESGVA
jgi:hypothetical protein